MKIAILGAGNVGATLGRRFAEVGHEIVFGVRDPAKYETAELPGAITTTGAAAASAGIIILALPYAAVEPSLQDAGDLAGKILVDATNPLAMTQSGLALTLGYEYSGGERVAALFPGSHVVKCFNTTGYGNMADPRGSMMFVCGNDRDSNEVVRQLSDQIGFETIDIGDITRSRLLEPLAMLWIHLAYSTDLRRDFAFGILRR